MNEGLAQVIVNVIKKGLLLEVALFFDKKDLLKWNLISKDVYHEIVPLAITSLHLRSLFEK